MLLTCQCCGIQREFDNGAEAFEAGWDAPPHFTGYIACNLCPAVCIVLHLGHTIAHALWEHEGRPAEFSVANCADDAYFQNMRRTYQ